VVDPAARAPRQTADPAPTIGLSRNRLGTRHLPRGTPREYPSGISTASTWNAKSTALWRPLAVRSSARIAHRQGGLRSASAPTQSRVRPIRLRPGDIFAAEPIFRSPNVLTVDRDVDRGDTVAGQRPPLNLQPAADWLGQPIAVDPRFFANELQRWIARSFFCRTGRSRSVVATILGRRIAIGSGLQPQLGELDL